MSCWLENTSVRGIPESSTRGVWRSERCIAADAGGEAPNGVASERRATVSTLVSPPPPQAECQRGSSASRPNGVASERRATVSTLVSPPPPQAECQRGSSASRPALTGLLVGGLSHPEWGAPGDDRHGRRACEAACAVRACRM
ncbi:LOW QUALITY PROTEIN: hypothetical protein Q4I31_000274 [Leishmania lindenbergi]|uniref:Uncharacterized protein n=1 Tax=Leishmania lindenbergi TaxID=651832 RepID=A0AAW3AXK1_9TRYP